VEARYHDSAGEPADELVAKARELDADLIVIGRRSRNPLRALLGSVSARVIRQAHCDVLVVR
jgi:universal stress protein G